MMILEHSSQLVVLLWCCSITGVSLFLSSLIFLVDGCNLKRRRPLEYLAF